MQGITEYAENIFKRHNVLSEAIIKTNIAIDEMFSNIVKFSKASYAKVSCKVKDNFAYLTFEDDGIAYNPLDREEPNVSLKAEERNVGGLDY